MFKTIKDLDINWLKNNHQLIHYFGLGFIQLKINNDYRLHFYTPELPPITDEEDVHNHRYNFTSKILKGEFSQDIFEVINGDSHLISDESCNMEIKSTTTPKPCSIKMISTHTYFKGSEYSLNHETFHRVRAKDCITLLKRDPKVKEFAQVIQKVNSTPICPFSKKIDDSKLWEIIEKMI